MTMHCIAPPWPPRMGLVIRYSSIIVHLQLSVVADHSLAGGQFRMTTRDYFKVLVCSKNIASASYFPKEFDKMSGSVIYSVNLRMPTDLQL